MSSLVRHKLTIRLSNAALATAQEGVDLGLSTNQNAFIEESIRMRAREVRHARMRRQAAEAMKDPDFVSDMHDVMHAFESADIDTWQDNIDPEATDR